MTNKRGWNLFSGKKSNFENFFEVKRCWAEEFFWVSFVISNNKQKNIFIPLGIELKWKISRSDIFHHSKAYFQSLISHSTIFWKFLFWILENIFSFINGNELSKNRLVSCRWKQIIDAGYKFLPLQLLDIEVCLEGGNINGAQHDYLIPIISLKRLMIAKFEIFFNEVEKTLEVEF